MMEGPNTTEENSTELDFTEDHAKKLKDVFPNGFGEAEQTLATRYVAEYFDTNEDATIDNAVDAFIEARKEIIGDGESFKDKDYTVNTGAQAGAGTVSMGIEIPKED